MGRMIDVDDIIDTDDMMAITGLESMVDVERMLSHRPDFPRPLGYSKLRLWSKTEIYTWAVEEIDREKASKEAEAARLAKLAEQAEVVAKPKPVEPSIDRIIKMVKRAEPKQADERASIMASILRGQ